jgi:UDP-N-acetylmuramoyl-tripeptide--D-alanyl-D-alanine ligase
MKTQWTVEQICKATNGVCAGDWTATSVSIDTRSMAKGALFVALRGERVDGHVYVKQALDNGAAGSLVSHAVDGVDAAKLVIVEDVEQALKDLGIAARMRTKAHVVGITGSVGKTGAKEMLAVALGAVGKVFASQANLNNHLGVPLNLANMPVNIDFAVIEMGMNHPGEIAPLSKMAHPHVSLITTVDAVHIENFPHVEAIADEKSAIFDGMDGKGVAILNADNAHFARCKHHALEKGITRVLSFGTNEKANCRMLRYAIEETHSLVEASIAGTRFTYQLGTIGKHWAVISTAILGIVDALGADIAKAASALQHFAEPAGRGEIRKLSVKGGQLRLIDDSYNASPVAVKGAIEKVAEIRAATVGECRTVVVLGDMLELGEHAEDMHVGLVPTLVNNQMDIVFAAGKFMQKMYNALPEAMRGEYRPTSAELAPVVVDALRARDLVLVKGSHGSRMDTVVEAIARAAREKTDAV